jgi:hypothetical protein
VGDGDLSPETTSLEVLFHACRLREADYTPERAERVRTVVDGMAEERPWPGCECHRNMEVHLPVPCGTEAGQHCHGCSELLEGGDDLDAWPGCSEPHVFHGACLELELEKSDRCPICMHSICRDISKEVDEKPAAASSTGGNANNVQQAIIRTLFGLLLFICVLAPFIGFI